MKILDAQRNPSERNNCPKRIYQSPVFTEYGTVAKLTEGGVTSSQSDHGTNTMKP